MFERVRAGRGPGEMVPALQILDAVGQGSVECGFTSALFYFGKDPSFAFGTALPFGLNSRQIRLADTMPAGGTC